MGFIFLGLGAFPSGVHQVHSKAVIVASIRYTCVYNSDSPRMNPGYPIIDLPSGYPLMANQVYRKIEHEMENEVYTWAFIITAISGLHQPPNRSFQVGLSGPLRPSQPQDQEA